KLVDQLGDDDEAVHKQAQKKLTDLGEDTIPALRRAAKSHDDADVRLRAAMLVAAIEKATYGEKRRFTGHTEGVVNFALSPDGTRFVSASLGRGTEHVARVWDLQTGKELFSLKGHEDSISGLSWSQDGERILTGSRDGSVRLWDARTGKQLKELTGHRHLVFHVALTPDGKKAVSCGNERTIRIWDLDSAKQVASNQDNSDDVLGVRSVTMMPDGKHFVSGGNDGTVRVIAVESGKQVRKMDGVHEFGARSVAASPDGKTIAS